MTGDPAPSDLPADVADVADVDGSGDVGAAVQSHADRSGHLDVVDIFDVRSRVDSDLDLVDELGLTDSDQGDPASGSDGGAPIVALRRGARNVDPGVFRRRRALAALGAAAGVVVLVVGGATVVRSVFGSTSGPATQGVSTLPNTSAAAPLTSRLHVESSSRAYTRANVATLAQDVLETPGTAYPFAPDSPDALSVTTASGLSGCLFTLGELDANRIAVDLATYEGAPAAIVVVIDGGLKQVYAVERTCTKGNPHTLAGPFPMT